MNQPMRTLMVECVNRAQKEICQSIECLNVKQCQPHAWQSRELNGGGMACIFTDGKLLEKGGVNVSTVQGKVFGEMINMLSIEQREHVADFSYFATGVSLVLHPDSPMVPTVHANFRYFEIEDHNKNTLTWFFGGGSDLTPYYLFEEDAIHFHTCLKHACDQTDKMLYPMLKKEADDYFYLPHRKEHRGIGGIFSLKMDEKNYPQHALFEWVCNCYKAFIEAYIPIAEKRMHIPYSEDQKKWQLVRRGRYVEFNLMYDLGTKFGFKSGGNAENILMSMPPKVSWEYNFKPPQGSPEETLLNVLTSPKEWIPT